MALENMYKLRELLLYKKIKKADNNTLELTDGTKIEFYLSDYDCCAGAYGEWILSDNFEGCITDVTYKHSKTEDYSDVE